MLAKSFYLKCFSSDNLNHHFAKTKDCRIKSMLLTEQNPSWTSSHLQSCKTKKQVEVMVLMQEKGNLGFWHCVHNPKSYAKKHQLLQFLPLSIEHVILPLYLSYYKIILVMYMSLQLRCLPFYHLDSIPLPLFWAVLEFELRPWCLLGKP
jgi:hypothetical protein